MGFSGGIITLRATTMIFALFALSTVQSARGELACTNDSDCSKEKYCYDVSSRCVDFTKCNRYNRLEASTPARQPSQCGPCRPGYVEELLGTGVPAASCKLIKGVFQQAEKEPENPNIATWPWAWGGCITAVVLVLCCMVLWLVKYARANGHVRIFEKVPFLNSASPTAPPQDDASYGLRLPSDAEEELPPGYSTVVTAGVDKDRLLKAGLSSPPTWVNKPDYNANVNANVADGAALPIRLSSVNIPMDYQEEEETNPSSWTPGQPPAVPSARPFALFAAENQENDLTVALVRGNSPQEDNASSDDGSEQPENRSGPRAQGDTFCGPNVQINQTITLNIAQGGMK